MIKIYRGKFSDNRVFAAIKWLEQHNMEYEVITRKELTENIIKKLLSLSDFGFDSILVDPNSVRRSMASRKFHNVTDFEKISTDVLIQYLLRFPSFIKTPIIFNDKKILVGFNNYEMRRFISKKQRKIDRELLLEDNLRSVESVLQKK